MGKAIIVIILGTIVAGSIMYMQSSATRLETTTRQAVYQDEMLAREIARSAHGIARMKIQQANLNYDLAIANINGWNADGTVNFGGKLKGAFQGGQFEVFASPLDGQNIKLHTTGIYNDVKETITSYYRFEMLQVKDPSIMNIEFIDSMAGYCSAVYLQQFIPISPGDSLFATTGVVSDDGEWFIKDPDMIFTAGHDRNGTNTTPSDVILTPGTQMNFFIGVDTNCSEEGVWVDDYDPLVYDWIHQALQTDSDISAMQETKYAMIEQHHANDQRWRIAFEDLTSFSDVQHADIKLNSYGDDWDEAAQTYGGSGWLVTDGMGYRALENTSAKPDFSDQVIQITLTPCEGSCEDLLASLIASGDDD